MESIDQVVLNFDKSAIWVINVTLAFIMFGIALDLKKEHFIKILKSPKSLLVGLSSQWIGLPLMTLLIIFLFKPQASLALGMIIVAACPGGNISNFFSSIASANVELSIVMTCISSVIAIIMTPIMLSLMGTTYGPAREILREVQINWIEVTMTIGLIIIIPIIIGTLVKKRFPNFSMKVKKPIRLLSMLAFVLIVIGALANNFNYFLKYIHVVFGLVVLHNLSAITTGFSLGKLFRLKHADVKSLSIETGIQNSGLGLLLIFSFFSGLGGMAIIAAFWGIWHIISGFAISFLFNKQARFQS